MIDWINQKYDSSFWNMSISDISLTGREIN